MTDISTASLPMLGAVDHIGCSLKLWHATGKPIIQGSHVSLCGMDLSNDALPLDDLFFLLGDRGISLSRHSDPEPRYLDVVNTGTLRNSFFPELFLHHTNVSRIELTFSLVGHWRAQIWYSVKDAQPALLKEVNLSPPPDHDANSPYTLSIPVQLANSLPANARLFWRASAQEDQARLIEANWSTQAPTSVSGRMLVLLRTFGRTRDVVDLLKSFEDEARRTNAPRYAHLLQNTFFMILDTSPGAEASDYSALSGFDQVHFLAVTGANLGGGGNMSQLLRLASKACETAGIAPEELLLLDDDLSISLEALYRHWASVLFRKDRTVFTLPVMMKSNPRRMWEDGAFWGRFSGAIRQGKRTQLAPRLLRHNMTFHGWDHLDLLAIRNYPEYSTFIFFSLPWSLFCELGHPWALFLRGDDIEFSLRLRKKTDARILSNPNLVAWHEPAHSYGQEYMSIAHGIIINMIYGPLSPACVVQYFHRQAIRHLSIQDVRGLALYCTVLEDLIARNFFLEHGFSTRYAERLNMFKNFEAEFECIPAEIVDNIRSSHVNCDKKLFEGPFLYMGVDLNEAIDAVLLSNHHNQTYRFYPLGDSDRMREAAAKASQIFERLATFEAQFDALRQHYTEKAAACQTAEFWDREMALHTPPRILVGSE